MYRMYAYYMTVTILRDITMKSFNNLLRNCHYYLYFIKEKPRLGP